MSDVDAEVIAKAKPLFIVNARAMISCSRRHYFRTRGEWRASGIGEPGHYRHSRAAFLMSRSKVDGAAFPAFQFISQEPSRRRP